MWEWTVYVNKKKFVNNVLHTSSYMYIYIAHTITNTDSSCRYSVLNAKFKKIYSTNQRPHTSQLLDRRLRTRVLLFVIFTIDNPASFIVGGIICPALTFSWAEDNEYDHSDNVVCCQDKEHVAPRRLSRPFIRNSADNVWSSDRTKISKCKGQSHDLPSMQWGQVQLVDRNDWKSHSWEGCDYTYDRHCQRAIAADISQEH